MTKPIRLQLSIEEATNLLSTLDDRLDYLEDDRHERLIGPYYKSLQKTRDCIEGEINDYHHSGELDND